LAWLHLRRSAWHETGTRFDCAGLKRVRWIEPPRVGHLHEIGIAKISSAVLRLRVRAPNGFYFVVDSETEPKQRLLVARALEDPIISRGDAPELDGGEKEIIVFCSL